MKRHIRRSWIMVVLWAGLLVHCTKKNSLEYGLDVKETIRFNLQVEPPTLDWTRVSDTTSGHVIHNVMDGLTDYSMTTSEVTLIPGLATEWHSSPDGKTWTFTLRKGVKWTDGTDFTAQQVLDGWERMMNPRSRSQYSYFFYSVKNAEAYFRGKIKDFSQVGFKINEQGQIVVELNRPISFFPHLLAHPTTYPIRKDVIAKHGEDKWAEAGNMISLGAYKLKTWDHDKAIVLERNDGYWGEKAKTKYVLGYMIGEYSTAISLFRSNRLDFQENIPWNQVAELKQLPGYHMEPILGFYYYGFNMRKPPFDNAKVRKAFAHAIDRKQITDLLGAGLQPLGGWVPRGMFGYMPEVGIQLDIELANRLMDEAGYKDRSTFPAFVIAFNTDENHQRIAENVQAQIKKNLGVRAEIENEEWKVYLSRLKNNTPSIYRLGWVTEYPDPDSFLKIMLSDSENNFTGWKDKAYDDLVTAGASELDKQKRLEIYKKAQTLLIEDAAAVFPIYSVVYPQLISPRLKNFPVNVLERLELKGVSIQ